MMKMYLTRYSLSNGGEIQLRSVLVGAGSDKYVYDAKSLQYRIGREAFETEKEAVQAVYEARTKKIASLRKQIHKLENLAAKVWEE